MLMKAIDDQVISLDKFNTVLAEIEAILKSLPLYWKKFNNGFEPLTPAHFLIGPSLTEMKPSSLHNVTDPSLKDSGSDSSKPI